MILGIQILGIIFGFFMFYITFLQQRRGEFTAKESIFWFGAWSALIFLMVFPTILDFFVKGILDLERRLDFFIIIGFIFVIGVLFHTYTIMRKTQNKVEKLVREIAINNANNKKKR